MAVVAKPERLLVKEFSCSLLLTYSSRLEARTSNPTLKNLLRQIPFRRVRNQRNNPLPWPKPLCDFQGGKHVGSRTRTSKDAFASGKLLHHVESLVVGDHHDFVAHRRIKILWNKTGADPFHFMRTRLTTAEH